MSNDANDFEDFREQRKKCNCSILWESDALLLNAITATVNRSKFTRAGSSSYGEDASKFTFMKLPLELRVMIYQQHFLQPRDAFIGCESCAAGTMCQYGIYNANIPVGELLLVSKTIYNEAMPVYFETKEFKFMGFGHMGLFLQSIGPRQRKFITHICIVDQGHNAHDVPNGKPTSHIYKLLLECTSLRRLKVMQDHLSYYKDLNTSTKHFEALEDRLLKAFSVSYHVYSTDSTDFYPDCKVVRANMYLAKKPPTVAHQDNGPTRDSSTTSLVRTNFLRSGPKTRSSSHATQRPLWKCFPAYQPSPSRRSLYTLFTRHGTNCNIPRIHNNFS